MFRPTLLAFLVAGLLSGCSSSPAPTVLSASAPVTAQASIAQLEADITRGYFSLLPEMATYYGVPEAIAGSGLHGRLTKRGVSDEVNKRDALRVLLSRLEAVDSASASDRDRNLHALLATQLRSALAPANVVEYGVALSDWGMWYVPYPVTQLSGPQDAVPKLLESQHTVRSAADAENYLSRLAAYGATVDDAIGKIEHDRKLGVVPPDFILGKALATLCSHDTPDAATHPLVASFREKLGGTEIATADALVQRARLLVADVVLPANRRLAAKLETLRAEAVHDAGIWRLPKGPELYQAMILHMTDTTMSPQQIHDLGLAEVARITSEMDVLLKAQGHSSGSVGDRMTALSKQPRFAYSNDATGKQRLLDDLNGQLAEIAPLLPQWFGRLPTQQVEVRAIPPQAEKSSSGGYYDAPALDGSRPGIYWINLRDTAIWPSYKLKTLTYHEGNPGHHLQTAIGMGLDAPIIASALYSNAFGEGWGLYAEALAHEMGLYRNDPYGDLGRLQDELHRSVRLVVDTGMHGLRWSRERAISYVVDTEGGHPAEAEAEVERYAVWPGQALGYKIGMLEIQRLRAVAEKALGEGFDIRGFHDEVLKDGGVPLQVLQVKVQRWVDRQQAPASR